MEGTIGEIRMFAATFSPKYWAYCNGQLLPIQQNAALFSILGTTYGGNGVTTFALPNMQSRVAVGTGSGPGLSTYQLGQMSGTETNTLSATNLPTHTHVIGGAAKMLTTTAAPNALTPGGNYFANDGTLRFKDTGGGGTMKPATVSVALGSTVATPVSNIMPFTGINYIICLLGIFPSRN